MFRLILISLFLYGCALADTDAGKVVAGVGIEKIRQEIVEVFTPVYPLYDNPTEFCSFDSNSDVNLTCIIIPCTSARGAGCIKKLTLEEFQIYSPKFITLESSARQLASVMIFCKKNPKTCIRVGGQYLGKKIVLKEIKYKK